MTATTAWVDDHFVAGDPVLDFANTVYRRRPELGADLFTDAEALTTWLLRTRLLPAAVEPFTDPDAALAEARALRSLLWTAFDAQNDGRAIPPQSLAGLLEIAVRGVGDSSLEPDGAITASAADGVLAVLALRAVTLLLHPPRQGVRACDRCGWFFIDSSRGRRRRWCSMRTCGNQAKAARYRSAHP